MKPPRRRTVFLFGTATARAPFNRAAFVFNAPITVVRIYSRRIFREQKPENTLIKTLFSSSPRHRRRVLRRPDVLFRGFSSARKTAFMCERRRILNRRAFCKSHGVETGSRERRKISHKFYGRTLLLPRCCWW